MRALHRNVNAPARSSQTDRVALLQPCNPDLVLELKYVIRMRAVGFGSWNAAIVDLPGESHPQMFTQHVPFSDNLPISCHFDYHVEPSNRDEESPVSRGINVMKIIKARQRNVGGKTETGKFVD